MNRKINNTSGFTLLEIIIVIIIVGILASVALPKFFKTVTFSFSAEALTNLDTLRGALNRCYAQTRDVNLCIPGGATDFSKLDVEDPNDTVANPNHKFAYSIAPGDLVVGGTYDDGHYTVTAQLVSDAGNTDKIKMDSTGQKVGEGNFSGIRN